MAQTGTLLKAQVDASVNAGAYISLHTADPGLTGANELNGGTPAYARVQTTYAVADTSTAGLASRAGTPASAHNVPAATTITHWGRWSAASGGTFLEGGTLPNSETFTGAGSYTLTHTARATG